jgi:hypothetical protein
LGKRLPPPTSPSLGDARHVVAPSGIVASGLPAVRETCAQIGLGFDPWQLGAARLILAKSADGLYAADVVVLSIPRQVGKTFLVGALVFADCIINAGTTTVWTAHQFKVSRETFNELRGLAESPALAPHVDPDAITTAAGNECIPFRNGSRIVFAARERGAVRGFAKVRRIILDEGQILTEAAMADMAPTQNQAENPQLIIMGTPPKPRDPSEVFTGLREEALSGRSEGLVYIEFSAEPGSDLDDRRAWREANPSYPSRTPARAILRLRKLLSSDDDFAREALGMWDAAQGFQVIDPGVWGGLADNVSQVEDPVAFAVDVAPMGRAASIGLAGRRADGRFHVEVVKNARGTEWLVPALETLRERWAPCAIVLDRVGPAAAVTLTLKEKGFDLLLTNSTEMAQACGGFLAAVTAGDLRHGDQPLLNAALGAARKRSIGDGGWGWNRRDEGQDITPLVSTTLALWGFQQAAAKPRRKSNGPARVVVMA